MNKNLAGTHIDVTELEKALKEIFHKREIDFSKINYAFGLITTLYWQSKAAEFPDNLGMLFLIENYLTFFLQNYVVKQLHKENKHDEAVRFENLLPERIPMLGVLVSKAGRYMTDLRLKQKLEEIVKDRNELTHRLFHSASDNKDIEKKAKELIDKIYQNFWDISYAVNPSMYF